jgi:hypothetical protein
LGRPSHQQGVSVLPRTVPKQAFLPTTDRSAIAKKNLPAKNRVSHKTPLPVSGPTRHRKKKQSPGQKSRLLTKRHYPSTLAFEISRADVLGIETKK